MLANLLLIPSNVFFVSVTVYFRSAWFFLTLSNSLLKFSPNSVFHSQVLWTSFRLFFKSLYQANYYFFHFLRFLFLSGNFSCFFERYSSVMSFCLPFCVCLYELDKVAFFSSLIKMVLCISRPCRLCVLDGFGRLVGDLWVPKAFGALAHWVRVAPGGEARCMQ